jgi:hypothetical protein
MSAARATQNRVARCSGGETHAHQLIPLQLLFATQAANGFLEGIGRDAAWRLDGWFHGFLDRGILERRRWFQIVGSSLPWVLRLACFSEMFLQEHIVITIPYRRICHDS